MKDKIEPKQSYIAKNFINANNNDNNNNNNDNSNNSNNNNNNNTNYSDEEDFTIGNISSGYQMCNIYEYYKWD